MNTIEKNFLIPEGFENVRADVLLSKLLDFPRAKIQAWIHSGELLVNQKQIKPSSKISFGEEVSLLGTFVSSTESWQKEEGLDPSWIVYEHQDFLIINKPSPMVVYPAAGNHTKTLANYLLGAYPELASLERAGFVHRIDKETTGLLVIARNQESMELLKSMISKREIKRTYELLVFGTPAPSQGSIDAPIIRHPKIRTRMAVRNYGKEAVTHYTLKEAFGGFSYLEARLESGRTHQIRLHFYHLGYPLVGEKTYIQRSKKRSEKEQKNTRLASKMIQDFERQALHAKSLTFDWRGHKNHFEAPTPKDFSDLLEALRNERSTSF